jgi:hypothetical protein
VYYPWTVSTLARGELDGMMLSSIRAVGLHLSMKPIVVWFWAGFDGGEFDPDSSRGLSPLFGLFDVNFLILYSTVVLFFCKLISVGSFMG